MCTKNFVINKTFMRVCDSPKPNVLKSGTKQSYFKTVLAVLTEAKLVTVSYGHEAYSQIAPQN